jgi:hypothetical protein
VDKFKEVLGNRVSRRRFIAGIGAGVGATAAVALAAGCSTDASKITPTTPAAPGVTDVDILNFALNLEYLEAEFYLRAATGSGLSTADALSGAGAVTGGSQVPLTGLSGTYALSFSAYLNEVAQDELNHVRALQAAITAAGGTPVARPQIDFAASFPGLASAAGVAGGASFTPFDSVPDFLIGSFVFEDVGVTAYTGAAPLISSAAVLNAAAGIQAVEAYHAAAVRTLIVRADVTNGNTAYETIANQVSALRGALGGGDETTLSPTGIVAAGSANAIAFGRTTDQVLHIVYATGGGSGVSSGGFFPAGLNGTIKTTAS